MSLRTQLQDVEHLVKQWRGAVLMMDHLQFAAKEAVLLRLLELEECILRLKKALPVVMR
jgi:hypothetical protein